MQRFGKNTVHFRVVAGELLNNPEITPVPSDLDQAKKTVSYKKSVATSLDGQKVYMPCVPSTLL